jgi:hypothetical protein
MYSRKGSAWNPFSWCCWKAAVQTRQDM